MIYQKYGRVDHTVVASSTWRRSELVHLVPSRTCRCTCMYWATWNNWDLLDHSHTVYSRFLRPDSEEGGPIKQAVYLCHTCASPRGVCSSCSITCHTDDEQVELFLKSHFRCDCPTSAVPHPCTLHKTTEGENGANQYGLCRCARPYDPKTERETMFQRLACEVVCLRVSPPPSVPSQVRSSYTGTAS